MDLVKIGSCSMSLLLIKTEPPSDLKKPVITLMDVVFPAPLGPKKPMTSPTFTSKESRFMALKSPKFLDISFTINIF